ncbi:M23 family metallopeptidase [Candidatus Aerophobetes bacterium]|nr:M23 family metallopeptidase [Candidatus Aerophobetes bacterium]
MKKKAKFFTLIVIPDSHGKVHRLVIPRFVIIIIVIGLIIGSFTLSYFINEYRVMREKLVYLNDLEKITKMQQKRILSLAEKVKQFNDTMEKLKKMEARLRALAGVGGGEISKQESLGEGGPEKYTLLVDPDLNGDKVSSLGLIKKIESNVSILEDTAKLQEKNLSKIQGIIQAKKDLFACTPNIFPVQGWISSGYGPRINPFTHKREMHRAIDIVAPWGTPVKAACQGRVSYAGWKKFYGLVVEIQNSYGYSTIYGHMSKILVKRGQVVKKGQVIGRVGSSGRSTGPHVHFEVWYKGKTLNPLNLMVEPLGSS